MVKPKRGEVWTIAGGGGRITAKPRPALIIQSDLFDVGDYITIALITSVSAESPVRVQLPEAYSVGLNQPSFVEADKITTVVRANLGKRIGIVPPATITEVERAILVFLDIAR